MNPIIPAGNVIFFFSPSLPLTNPMMYLNSPIKNVSIAQQEPLQAGRKNDVYGIPACYSAF